MTLRQVLFFGICMSVFMSAAMSAVMVVINAGLNEHFFEAWPPSFGIGFLVSLPFAFFLPSLLLGLPPSLSATIISVLLHFYVVLLDSFFKGDLPLGDGDSVLWQD